jgi:hypothetical protein
MDPISATAGAAALGPALTKVADKTIDGVGAFFGAICMPAAEEFGLLLRDRVNAFQRETWFSCLYIEKRGFLMPWY